MIGVVLDSQAVLAAVGAGSGVVVYDFDEADPADIKVLLVREKKGLWSLFAGEV